MSGEKISRWFTMHAPVHHHIPAKLREFAWELRLDIEIETEKGEGFLFGLWRREYIRVEVLGAADVVARFVEGVKWTFETWEREKKERAKARRLPKEKSL